MQTTILVAANHSLAGEEKQVIGVLLKPSQFIRISLMPAWKGTIVSRAFARLTRYFGVYRYYRGRGFNSKASWYLAGIAKS
jgi:hypothetical protein